MATIEVRQVRGQELLDTADPLTHYAFGPSPPHLDRAAREKTLPSRADQVTLVLFEDGQPRATTTTLPMRQNVRGALLAMGAVAGVATHPAGRRQGYARRVLTEALARMRADGQVVSCLYPFRGSFYARLGYASFPPERHLVIRLADLAPLARQTLPGNVTMTSMAEGYETYRDFLQALQPAIHGLALRSPVAATRQRDRDDHWLAIARVEGQPVGVMTYRIKGEPVDLHAEAFLYTDAAGKYLLLQWLARHADHARHAHLTLPGTAYPETWLHDLGVRLKTLNELFQVYDQMGRVVDVERLTGIGAGDGRFTARVRDERCPWNNAVFAFSAGQGRLSVERVVETEAACDLSIEGLSALVYSGHDPADFPFRGWGDPDPATRAAMRALFPPALPFLFEHF